MNLKQKETQLQFQGFLNTSFLWKGDDVMDLKQIKLSNTSDYIFNETLPDNLRLGKRVERFVSSELKRCNSISICCENIQVQQNKITLGEIDCVLKQHHTPIHLEIVYKFYLYDAHDGQEELQRWIGPNRKDSLVKKLNKLKNKQLPLLYNQHTKPILDDLKIPLEDVQQQVYFKAQLFLPYNHEVNFSLLNPNCANGYYIHFSELKIFTQCKFYIPTKHNWLIEPISQVDWLNYELFYKKIKIFISHKIATLCWFKFPNGEIKKYFVVWWP